MEQVLYPGGCERDRRNSELGGGNALLDEATAAVYSGGSYRLRQAVHGSPIDNFSSAW
jgi:hypothetical protein